MYAVVGPPDTTITNPAPRAAGPFWSKREAEAWVREEHLERLWTVVEMYQPDADD